MTLISGAEAKAKQAEAEVSQVKNEKRRIEAPVSIQDIVVIGQHPEPGASGSYGTGEYDSRGITHASGSLEHTNAQKRVLETIEQFVTNAANVHKTNCCNSSGQLQPDKKNHITRLSTNEFLFYTNNPLELSEFQALMGDIAKLAAQQPENLHLVLSSFGVRDPNGAGILNVVPYVQCGSTSPNPQINFVVKNYPSDVDPKYIQTLNIPFLGINNLRVPLTNLGITNYPLPDGATLNIGGKACPISYNNVIRCKTAGEAEFYAGIDICLDHCYEVAKKNLEGIEKKTEKSNSLSPVQKWLLITSNWVEAEEKACSRRTTYADMLSDQTKEPSERFSTKCKPKLESPLAPTSLITTFPQSGPNYQVKSYERAQCSISNTLENHNEKILKRKEDVALYARANFEMSRRHYGNRHNSSNYRYDNSHHRDHRIIRKNNSSTYRSNNRGEFLTSYNSKRNNSSLHKSFKSRPSSTSHKHGHPRKPRKF